MKKAIILMMCLMFAPQAQARTKTKITCKIPGIEQAVFDEVLSEIGLEMLLNLGEDIETVDFYFVENFFNKKIRRKDRFERLVKDTVNLVGNYDCKKAYLWMHGEIDYPTQIVYDDLIETDFFYMFYVDRQIVQLIMKKYVDAKKFEYYYKGILCKETLDIETEKTENRLEELIKISGLG